MAEVSALIRAGGQFGGVDLAVLTFVLLLEFLDAHVPRGLLRLGRGRTVVLGSHTSRIDTRALNLHAASRLVPGARSRGGGFRGRLALHPTEGRVIAVGDSDTARAPRHVSSATGSTKKRNGGSRTRIWCAGSSRPAVAREPSCRPRRRSSGSAPAQAVRAGQQSADANWLSGPLPDHAGLHRRRQQQRVDDESRGTGVGLGRWSRAGARVGCGSSSSATQRVSASGMARVT